MSHYSMRRFSMCIGCVSIAALALLFASKLAQSEPPAPGAAPVAPATRSFRLTYKATLPAPAAGSKVLEAWIPVPTTDDLQTVSDLKVDAGGTLQTDAEYGNRMVHVRAENPASAVTLGWSAVITRRLDEGQGMGTAGPRFLAPDLLVPLDGKAAAMAGELGVKDATKPVRDRAKAIYDNVLSTMIYDKEAPGWGKGDFNRACEVGKGNCTDFHAKFTGIGRAASIPVRFTMGFSIPTDASGPVPGYHCWAHFYDAGHWVPVDVSEAQKLLGKDDAKAQWFFGHLDVDRVGLSVGRDLTLAPAQKGPKLNLFVNPYAEVDGKPVEVAKEARAVTYATVSDGDVAAPAR